MMHAMDVGASVLDRVIRQVTDDLARAGIDSAGAEAELLAAHVIGVDRADLARQRALGRLVSVPEAATLRDLVVERCKRVPLQHLTGKAHLRTVTVDVGPGVFVPRPETEVTVEHTLAAVLDAGATGRTVRLVDLCTGSAVVPVAVVAEAAAAGVEVRAVGVELDPQAVAWATRNAQRYGAGRVEIRAGGVAGCATGLCGDLAGRVDVVSANPPYIPDGELPKDVEARDHDPALALFAGPDGLTVVRDVAAAAALLLRDGGTLVVEHGERQGDAVAGILSGAGLESPRTHPDLTGRPRVTVAAMPR